MMSPWLVRHDMPAYYNELDPKAAAWLRELIKRGHIADGEVDERSIELVQPGDIRCFTQCHFFAGIGGWSLALRLAGWPDDRPVWTGSCPCQPFSAAGKRQGPDDARHLWPELFRLIQERRPIQVLGEQVASPDGLAWLDTVLTDLEGADYAAGAVDLCAAGVGAPHIRQRLWWHGERLAGADCGQRGGIADRQGCQRDGAPAGWQQGDREPERRGAFGGIEHTSGVGRIERRAEPGGRGVASGCGTGGLDNSISPRLEGHGGDGDCGRQPGWFDPFKAGPISTASLAGRLADASDAGSPRAGIDTQREGAFVEPSNGGGEEGSARPGPLDGFWRDADWLHCRDGKWRPVEPGTFPLAHGLPARVGRLRGYGNAIVPQVAAAFIESIMEE